MDQSPFWKGLAYQLIDDIPAFTGTSASLGKVSLSDIWFMLRFEVKDHIGTTIFVALDNEIQKLVHQTEDEFNPEIGTSNRG
ncbi:hypothetical protein C5167_048805 [Papaver somniferum]|uniref:Uncharacterized protein n=1 Tax=Papaver somniferum TaxID=3469 RepID=A0A4Y7KJ00_PAPSO|nr:hypothetical protein C5167_048805 [Papaver somniferum]